MSSSAKIRLSIHTQHSTPCCPLVKMPAVQYSDIPETEAVHVPVAVSGLPFAAVPGALYCIPAGKPGYRRVPLFNYI